MMTQTADPFVLQKTKELCEAIVAQPEFQNIRSRIDAFLADEGAKMQYQSLVEMREMLEQKQQNGLQLSEQEVNQFDRSRDALVKNPVARDFLDAQQAMHKMQESVGQYVAKTFELGRTPTEEDFDSGSCGHGCGCHH